VTFVLRDRWRCEELLAASTTATVWRAHDQLLARMVAVRIVKPEEVDAQASERAARLLEVAGRLQHQNVACLFDIFLDTEVGIVLIGELVEGPTLHELLRAHGQLPAEVVAAVGVQLAEGAGAIHAAGAVHRDLCPVNVRLSHDGTLKILGLGAARLLAADDATPVGAGLTLDYLAPEQLAGEPTDQRTDIYAIGVILSELATGEPPSTTDPPTEVTGPRRPRLPSLRSASRRTTAHLSEAIETATRRDPDERWQDARALIAVLGPLCQNRPNAILRDFAAALLPAPPDAMLSLEHADHVAPGSADAPPNR
jgi:serine/threonine protein kinase